MAKLYVKEICKQKGISLRDLATDLEISPSALSQTLKEDSNPSLNTLEKMAKTLRVSIPELFGSGDDLEGNLCLNGTIYGIKKYKDALTIPQLHGIDDLTETVRSFVRRCIASKDQDGCTMYLFNNIVLFSIFYQHGGYFNVALLSSRDGMEHQSFDIADYQNPTNVYDCNEIAQDIVFFVTDPIIG